jgi:phosphoglycolate phosphatase
MNQLQAVLFDLDGTLLDTAPDMVESLLQLLSEESAPAIDYIVARAHVSNGALGLIDIGFARQLNDETRFRLRDRYLEIYAARVAVATTLFPGMAEVLASLERLNLAWGVVTNKPGCLTEPLLAALDLLPRCACVVSGDTLAERKPHPGPLLHAAQTIGVDARQTAYVGDAGRDIQAGKAAGMVTIAAAYGYIPPQDDPADWAADYTIEHPRQLLAALNIDV